MEEISFSTAIVCVMLCMAWTSRGLCFWTIQFYPKGFHAASCFWLVILFARCKILFYSPSLMRKLRHNVKLFFSTHKPLTKDIGRDGKKSNLLAFGHSPENEVSSGLGRLGRTPYTATFPPSQDIFRPPDKKRGRRRRSRPSRFPSFPFRHYRSGTRANMSRVMASRS